MERIIKFSGVTDETVGREQILEKIEQVDFTCFERGKTEGFLLVKKGFVAKELVEKMENNPGNESYNTSVTQVIINESSSTPFS